VPACSRPIATDMSAISSATPANATSALSPAKGRDHIAARGLVCVTPHGYTLLDVVGITRSTLRSTKDLKVPMSLLMRVDEVIE
jgi:hypothetical protein